MNIVKFCMLHNFTYTELIFRSNLINLLNMAANFLLSLGKSQFS